MYFLMFVLAVFFTTYFFNREQYHGVIDFALWCIVYLLIILTAVTIDSYNEITNYLGRIRRKYT